MNGRVFRTSTTITTFTSTRPAHAAAIALSRRILREGEAGGEGLPRLPVRRLLCRPDHAASGAGVDMASPKPVEDATKLFDEMISEMEKILN